MFHPSAENMSRVSAEPAPRAARVWVALKRLYKNDDRVVALREVLIPPKADLATVVEMSNVSCPDDRVVALREVLIPPKADLATVVEIFSSTFRLDSPNPILKMRNHRGFLIPLNGSVPVNSKHKPYVLEVTNIFQHVAVKARTIPMTVINKNMKTRLHIIDRRIQRLEELLPHVKHRHNDKLTQEVECLTQKLNFLHQRMQIADSHTWKGMLTRAPLW